MANFNIKLDLRKLAGAFVTDFKGRTETKRCLVIPIDDAALYEGASGIYLDLTAMEMREPRYSDTHCVKQQFGKDAYKAMTEEQRKAIPILGGMREFAQPKQAVPTYAPPLSQAAPGDGQKDDLPF